MSTKARVHGMDGTMVDADWPPLTLDEVRPVLHAFSRRAPTLADFLRKSATFFRC